MKGSVKLFIASLIVLAAAIGFFVGSVCMKPCHKGPMAMDGMLPPPPPGVEMPVPPDFNGKNPPPDFGKRMPPPAGIEGEGPRGDHHKGPQGEHAENGHGPKGPHGSEGPDMMPPPGMGGPGMLPPDMKGPKQKGPNPEMMDSLLQITPEQKAALEKNRTEVEKSFKELKEKKHEAEKALGEALDAGDEAAIKAAREKVLATHTALLDHRINSVTALNKILTKEQIEKFHGFFNRK